MTSGKEPFNFYLSKDQVRNIKYLFIRKRKDSEMYDDKDKEIKDQYNRLRSFIKRNAFVFKILEDREDETLRSFIRATCTLIKMLPHYKDRLFKEDVIFNSFKS